MEFFVKRQERAEIIRAYKRVFESEDGKRVLADLMKNAHMYRSTMDPNPHELAYKEGERSMVLKILRTIKADPSELETYLNKLEGQSQE